MVILIWFSVHYCNCLVFDVMCNIKKAHIIKPVLKTQELLKDVVVKIKFIDKTYH